jgi:pimeloyl-ACP methyl ester carboxylesterase
VGVEQSLATGRVATLDVGGATVAVRQWGDESGRPLLFWHALGALTSGAWLSELAPTLTAGGRLLVAIDGPGFGASPPRPPEAYAIAHLAGLLWDVVGELGLERPVLMGHSWGGTVAVRAAADRPSSTGALVLLDSGHVDYADDPRSEPEATLEQRVAAMRERRFHLPSLDALREELAAEVRRELTPELLQAVEAGLRVLADGSIVGIPTPETGAAAMQGAVAERPSTSWPVLADAGVPVLLLLATEPEEGCVQNEKAAERFRAEIPHAEIRFCDGWGHDLIANGGPALAEIVVEWLDRAL